MTPKHPRASRKGGPRPGVTDEDRKAETITMLQLRQSGASYEAIGKQVGLSAHTVWSRIKTVMDAQPVPEAQYLRDMEVMRLDSLDKALEDGIRDGDVQAVNAARQLSESRRKLLGLDRPAQIEATINRNTEALAAQILDEFMLDLGKGDEAPDEDEPPMDNTETTED